MLTDGAESQVLLAPRGSFNGVVTLVERSLIQHVSYVKHVQVYKYFIRLREGKSQQRDDIVWLKSSPVLLAKRESCVREDSTSTTVLFSSVQLQANDVQLRLQRYFEGDHALGASVSGRFLPRSDRPVDYVLFRIHGVRR